MVLRHGDAGGDPAFPHRTAVVRSTAITWPGGPSMTRLLLAQCLAITLTGCGSTSTEPVVAPSGGAVALADPAPTPSPWETIDPTFEGCGSGG